MEIFFKTLQLRNFLSYGNNLTTINLHRPGTTLIIGEDLDRTSEGTGANGVGKSSIINALSYALYDKPISNISKDNLVNNINKKNMEVSVEFVINGTTYVVKRERKTKAGAAGNNVYLFVDGKDCTLDSAANTNQRIEEIIGIPYDLFVRIVVFFASHTPFLDLSKNDQTSIFERLVGLTFLSDKATLLKESIKDSESALQLKKAKIDLLKKEHDRHTSQLSNAKDRVDKWYVTRQQDIDLLQAQLDKLNGVDLDHQQTLQEELALINGQITREFNLFESVEKRIDTYTDKLNEARSNLEHLKNDKCPYCLQQYTDTGAKIAELTDVVAMTTTEIKVASQELIRLDQLIESLEDTRKGVMDQLTIPNVREMLQIRSQSDSITTKIETLKTAINPHIESYEELSQLELDDIQYDEINALVRDIEHQKFLLKLLTKKDSFVRKELLNNYIPYLNGQLQRYLTELGLPHKVEFTHEMSANISQFGRGLDFGNLSAGQKARVNLALSLAFRDVLQRLHSKINICLLDEVLDVGLDAVGAKAATKLLKRRAEETGMSLYVISHREEMINSFDSTLTIQLSKGFSYIVDNITPE